VVVVDRGVPGVTRGSGNSGGERDGHEAKTFPLQVLHGGAHVLLHELGHLVLGEGEVVVRRHCLVAVRGASNGPAINLSLNTVTTTRDGARKFYGRGPANKNFRFSRIFLLKKFIFVIF
jgi:hypothetical protein